MDFLGTTQKVTNAQDMVGDLLKQQERYILEQLSELVSRGLIAIESTQPVLTQRYSPETSKTEIFLEQAIKLVPKEKEYIEELEARIEELEGKLDEYTDILSKINEVRNG